MPTAWMLPRVAGWEKPRDVETWHQLCHAISVICVLQYDVHGIRGAKVIFSLGSVVWWFKRWASLDLPGNHGCVCVRTS